ncbi:hypothetical protein E4U09_001855 [Claviceps aff. purpurea]|uniref:Uncharacterized protein n=1 Tax=Claviceps aff. purpurea TaxID=1967640 RepID=A0A9P7QGK1_9HYPO|nr:hypothetical protein E4U09_001855 [Claviceps aff. purpurea]
MHDTSDHFRRILSIGGLEHLTDEFPKALDVVKPLSFKIRDILFCTDQDGEMIFGTPLGDPDQLYGPVIAAFGQAISTL